MEPQPRTHREPEPRHIKVLVLPTHEDPHLAVVEARLQSYWALVGGYIQHVPLRVMPGAAIFVNEDGKNQSPPLPVNIFASAVAHLVPSSLRTGDMIVGPAVIVGTLNAKGEQDGHEHDVPMALVDLLRQHGIPVDDATEDEA